MLLKLAILAKDSVGQTISIKYAEEAFNHLRDNMTGHNRMMFYQNQAHTVLPT